jgi:hypothetical protein
MAIDLQKLEQKFNDLLNDPNFVTDFEQWLEARNVSQNSSKPIVSRSKCDFHAVFTFCGDNGVTYCSNCGDTV